MKTLVSRFVKDESGATAIEYGLIAAGISVAIIAVVNGLGTKLNTTFASVSSRERLPPTQIAGVSEIPWSINRQQRLLTEKQIIAVYNLLMRCSHKRKQSEVRPWVRIVGDQVSTDARAVTGAVTWIRGRKSKSEYKAKGGPAAIADPVWTDG